MFGLYVHIPLCRHICAYCDFFKMVVSNNYQDKVINAICRELDDKNHLPYLDTVYIGGGTPSSLSLPNLDSILTSINNLLMRTNHNLDVVEYTIELNPEDINIELINLLKKYPINRLSIGVQSFNKEVQNILGRQSDYELIKSKIDLLKANNFNNINLDYIYSVLPSSIYTPIIQEKDLELFMSLKPTHLSCYSLIVEEKTILGKKASIGEYIRPNDEDDLNQYLNMKKVLKGYGFYQYEISNYASNPKYESKHNKIYWHNECYVGIGPNASGYEIIDGQHIRYTNHNKINEYENKQLLENEVLTISDIMDYEIILGLRLVEGIDEIKFYEKFGVSVCDAYPKIKDLLKNEIIIEKDNYIFVNEKHLYVLDYILKEIL